MKGIDDRIAAAGPEMFMALLGLQVIAEQRLDDLVRDIVAGGTRDAVWRMEWSRWQAVIDAIKKVNAS